MKKILTALRALVAVPLCFLALSAGAQAPQPPEIAARAYILMDVTANQILASKDIDMPVEQASLTKLMTGYLVFDALKSKKIDLKQTLPVSVRAWKTPGSRMFIDPKMQVPVEDLIKGMIVQSGNDATVALAEGVGGTVEHFVELMNVQAKALGEYGVDALFHPTVDEMYPSGSVGSTVVDVPGLTDILCGVFRPGHFQGVATVVVKLLCLVQPDVAIFGEKDFQQLTVIRRVVEDLNLPVKIVGATKLPSGRPATSTRLPPAASTAPA